MDIWKEVREEELAALAPRIARTQQQETMNQEISQLKVRLAHLCRPCSWDWTLFQGNCYFFSKSLKNWTDSVTACEEMEAQLVIIESDEEQRFLLETSKKNGLTWIGLSDRKEEGAWSWMDDSPLLYKFSMYWLEGEPNNIEEEDCAELKGDGWNDNKCELHKFWICKKPEISCPHK
ncbi:CD209 antigen-like protein C isoform X2 [Cavia porcellus]|uniref:CD209 antigen-like protein C isoform X2 n=1 Tax=Cavia porcellus TaxID=10141 RepID=UPI000661E1C8